MAKDADEHADPWEAQIRKGCLEMAVLACLWKSRLYGLEILRGLERTSSLGLAEGTLYVILNRLKAEGLVQSEWIDAGSGHPRKYYWLAAPGRTRLRSMARFWAQFSGELDALLEPVLGGREVARAHR